MRLRDVIEAHNLYVIRHAKAELVSQSIDRPESADVVGGKYGIRTVTNTK